MMRFRSSLVSSLTIKHVSKLDLKLFEIILNLITREFEARFEGESMYYNIYSLLI